MAYELPISISHNLMGVIFLGDCYVRQTEIDSFMFLSVLYVNDPYGNTIISGLWWHHHIETITLRLVLSNE